jgi:hypothetical protein
MARLPRIGHVDTDTHAAMRFAALMEVYIDRDPEINHGERDEG